MKKCFFISLLVLGCSLAFENLSYAQSAPADANSGEAIVPAEAPLRLLANVGIEYATITSQKQNDVEVSFDVVNGPNAQPDVVYGIRLVDVAGGKNLTIDEKVFSEHLSLGINDRVKRKVSYKAPTFLQGTYQVWVISQNSSGLPMGLTPAGEVKLTGSGQWSEIITKSCYITVNGEEGGKKYMLSEGVDINPDEALTGHCDVVSHFSQSKTLTPQMETRYRNAFGEVVPASSVSLDKITIAPNEKKTVSLELPKAEKPQAYSAILTFIDDSGQVVSNAIPFHYVLRGASATIQNFRVDGDKYSQGNIFQATFNWTVSADSFPNSRLGATTLDQSQVNISLKNGSGASCIDDIQKVLPSEKDKDIQEISIPITLKTDCDNPQWSAIIVDKDGKILDDLSFAAKNSYQKTADISNNYHKPGEQKPSNIKKYIWMIVGILLIFSLILIVIFKKWGRKSAAVILLSLLASGPLFFNIGQVQAAGGTLDSGIVWLGAHTVVGAVYTINLNQDNYNPGETIVASGSTNSFGYCINGPNYIGSALDVEVNGSGFQQIFNFAYPWGGATSGALYFQAPWTPGTYYANFRGHMGGSAWLSGTPYTITKTVSLQYTVVAPPPVCTVSSWSPAPNAVCPSTWFQQTSNCGTTQWVQGTKPSAYACVYNCSSTDCDHNKQQTCVDTSGCETNPAQVKCGGGCPSSDCSAGCTAPISGWKEESP